MMESMIINTIPTRAEVSDVANAVMEGTDAVMLSAETAAGKHPAKVVEAMAQIIVGAEKYQGAHVRIRQRNSGYFERTDEAIAAAVMYTANHLHVKAIVALTESGETALWMSRVRSDIPIYAFTRQEIDAQPGDAVSRRVPGRLRRHRQGPRCVLFLDLPLAAGFEAGQRGGSRSS